MNVGEVKKAMAAYLQKPVNEFMEGGVDLLLIACNNARKVATRMHDWNCERVQGYGTLTDGIGNWKVVKDVTSDLEIVLKQPESFYLKFGENLLPVNHHTRKHGKVWAAERNRARGVSSAYRYLGDDNTYREHIFGPFAGTSYNVYVHGENFEVTPAVSGEMTFHIDGYLKLDDYTQDSDTDFFTEEGHDYLVYAGIVEANHLVQTFIPQQEGNLSPPEKLRDDALATLIEMDSFLIESGRQPMRP